MTSYEKRLPAGSLFWVYNYIIEEYSFFVASTML